MDTKDKDEAFLNKAAATSPANLIEAADADASFADLLKAAGHEGKEITTIEGQYNKRA